MLRILFSTFWVNKACSSWSFFFFFILTRHSQNETVFGSLVVFIGSYCHFFDPYEDEPTIRLSSALGNKEAIILVLEVSSQFPPTAWSLIYSHSCAPFLNRWKYCIENKYWSIFFVYIFLGAKFSLSLILFPLDTFLNTLFLLIANLDFISADIRQNILIHKIIKGVFFPNHR